MQYEHAGRCDEGRICRTGEFGYPDNGEAKNRNMQHSVSHSNTFQHSHLLF